MLARVSLLGALLAALAGCEPYISGSVYTCTDPEKGHLGPDGEPDPCHYRDADKSDLSCAVGDYIHWQNGWDAPSLLWIGPEDQAPECPLGPMTIGYEGRTDLVAPNLCESCSCELPTGSCALSSTLTASNSICGKPGAPTSFNAPDPWDGQCDSTTQVPQGVAHSLTIAPLLMTENGCASGPTIPAKIFSLHWDTFARACDMDWPLGPLQRSLCLPNNPIPPGFELCIFQNGENDCPTEPGNVFTEQHVFYKGVEDDRQCSACTCGAPTGSACTATISINKGNDLTCSGPTFAQIPISSVGPVCVDIALPGQALGSKSAGPTTDLPGTCPAMGGDASGIAVKTKPATLCCRPKV